ncbi:MAG: hypothetical protein MZV70_77350 [Desulfobacterales bacterium]|nr:hypothetical protein [Desulfobacterales bacterium]
MHGKEKQGRSGKSPRYRCFNQGGDQGKGISMDLVLDTLKRRARVTAAKKYLGEPTRVEAKVDKDSGMIDRLLPTRPWSESIVDPEKQITPAEEQRPWTPTWR